MVLLALLCVGLLAQNLVPAWESQLADIELLSLELDSDESNELEEDADDAEDKLPQHNPSKALHHPSGQTLTSHAQTLAQPHRGTPPTPPPERP